MAIKLTEFFQNGMLLQRDAPGKLFQYMVQKAAQYAVRGILWYQGESDDEIDGTQKKYGSALKTIISDWRAAWKNENLPFFVVQLPGFGSWMGFEDQNFSAIRKCQQEVADAPRIKTVQREGNRICLQFEYSEGRISHLW